MTHVPLADAKARLSEYVGRVCDQHERVTVAVHGQPSAVLLSVDDVESLEETIAILADADGIASLIASEAEITRGETVSQEELDAVMAARRRSAL